MRRHAYPLLLALLGTALGVSTVPAPLYALYMERWDLTPVVTTIVFAAYALAALVAVLVSGAISDAVGRKPVIAAAVIGMLAGLVIFMLAPEFPDAARVPLLMMARVIHGASVGASVVVVTAALLDLRPEVGARTGHLTSIAFNTGITITILAAAALAAYGPLPLVLPYAAMTAVVIAFGIVVLALDEPHQGRHGSAIRITRPRVPAEITTEFGFAALGAVASWSVLGVFLSLFPGLAADATGVQSVMFGGAVVAASSAAAVVSQVVAGGRDAARVALVGDLGTAASLLAAIVALHTGSAWGIALVACSIGFFFGMAFGGSLRYLTQVVPEAQRGEVMSAFYVLAYAALALPTIAAGAAATIWGLEQVFGPFMATVAAASLTAAALGWRATRSPVANNLRNA